MREIVVKSLTSDNWLNRDCCVTETMRQGDIVTRVMRRCTYKIESRVTVPTTDDSINWAHAIDPQPPRQVHVLKDIDPETGHERVSYKVLGRFYVVVDRDVFCIGYRHILSMAVDAAFDEESSKDP